MKGMFLMEAKKYVYLFKEGNAKMRNLLGGKGANLAEMTNLGIPVPQGFTITTEACTKYYEDGKELSKTIIDEIYQALSSLEKETGKKRSEEHTSELQSRQYLVCRLLLEKKKRQLILVSTYTLLP